MFYLCTYSLRVPYPFKWQHFSKNSKVFAGNNWKGILFLFDMGTVFIFASEGVKFTQPLLPFLKILLIFKLFVGHNFFVVFLFVSLTEFRLEHVFISS